MTLFTNTIKVSIKCTWYVAMHGNISMEILAIFPFLHLLKMKSHLCLKVLRFSHVVPAVFFESYINYKQHDNHIAKRKHCRFPDHSKEKYYNLCILLDFLKLNE